MTTIRILEYRLERPAISGLDDKIKSLWILARVVKSSDQISNSGVTCESVKMSELDLPDLSKHFVLALRNSRPFLYENVASVVEALY
jgi:hypothetical protein